MALRLEYLIPGGAAVGFVLGRVVLGGGSSSGAPGDGSAGVDTSMAAASQSQPDLSALGDTASVVYGWNDTGAGTINGILPGGADPYGSGGLPGGGDQVPPPFEPPPPAPAQGPGAGGTSPTPLPAPTPTKPAGAWKLLTANGLRTLYTYSGGIARPTTYQTGKHFTAWVAAPVHLRTASGTATFVKILSGLYAGRYVHTSDPGVSFS